MQGIKHSPEWPPPSPPRFTTPPSEMGLLSLELKIERTFKSLKADYVANALRCHCLREAATNTRRNSVHNSNWHWGDKCFPLAESKALSRSDSRLYYKTILLHTEPYTGYVRCWLYGANAPTSGAF